MKFSEVFSSYSLFEANILNIKDEHNNVSVVGYLKQFTQNLPGFELQNAFIKKISNLLVNDERYHYAVREVPANAPDWAKRAIADQTLFAFQPTPQLTEILQHITHYLAAATEDATKSPSPDQRVFAQRELAAFPKAENLDVIKKHSDEFFVRGSRKVGREVTGMEKIFDAGQGFLWYKLTDENAFRREGKALQNCIGTIYTKARIEKENKAIVILKNPSNESVVAMSVEVPTRTMIEVKGKNNRPPIEKYMFPTAKLINYMKLTPSNNAIHDLVMAGYFYDKENKEILTKSEAIKRFITIEPVTTVESNLTVNKAIIKNESLFNVIYATLLPHDIRYIRDKLSHIDVYDLRDSSNTPIVTAIVLKKEGGILASVVAHSKTQDVTETEEISPKAAEHILIKTLLKLGIVKTINKAVERQLILKHRMVWKEDKGDFEKLLSKENISTDEKHIRWNIYKDQNTIKRLITILKRSTEEGYSYYSQYLRDDLEESDITAIYVDSILDTSEDREDSTVNLILKTKDGAALPVRAILTGGLVQIQTQNAGFLSRTTDRDHRVLDSLLALANREKLRLPKTVRLNHGIFRENNKYEQFEPKFEKVAGKIPALKLDLSKMSTANRLAALTYVTSNSKYVAAPDSFYDTLTIKNAIMDTLREREEYFDDTAKWKEGELDEIYNNLFAGRTPETLYVLDIKYGVDKKTRATLLADGKKILRVDSQTFSSRWQKWADYDTVAEQLNQFAADHGLTFDPRSIVYLGVKKPGERSYHSELRVSAEGKISTASIEKAKQIEMARQKGRYAMEGTDELKFADGAKLVRMTPDEQAQWVREVMRGEGGRAEAWRMFDKDGEGKAIITIDNGRLIAMYGRPSEHSETIDHRGLVFSMLPYLKKAVETFGWKLEKAKIFQIRPHSRLHWHLKEFFEKGSRRRRHLRDLDIILANLKLFNIEQKIQGAVYNVSITEKGKEVLNKLTKNEGTTVFEFVNAADLPKKFVAPIRKQKPPRVRKTVSGKGRKWKVSTAAPREGTKAELALEKFREMTTANNQMPTRAEFINVLKAPPFNMSAAGAQTYYYTTKAKYIALGEAFSAQAARELREDPLLRSFRLFLVS